MIYEFTGHVTYLTEFGPDSYLLGCDANVNFLGTPRPSNYNSERQKKFKTNKVNIRSYKLLGYFAQSKNSFFIMLHFKI